MMLGQLRQPDAWESSATSRFVTIGAATVTALWQARFLIAAPGASTR
jgi:hypothetical protein